MSAYGPAAIIRVTVATLPTGVRLGEAYGFFSMGLAGEIVINPPAEKKAKIDGVNAMTGQHWRDLEIWKPPPTVLIATSLRTTQARINTSDATQPLGWVGAG